MSRATDRRPHSVGLYLNGTFVTTATVAWTDPRFVKAEDLMIRALQEMKDREARGRRHDDKMGEWNEIKISFGWMTLHCDINGNRILDPNDLLEAA